MPSRKQRRRRQKERRHDYEYVYVDGEGREVEAGESGGSATARGDDRRRAGAAARSGLGRRLEPPSWRRVARRGLIFAPLMFLTLSLLNDELSVLGTVLNTAVLLAFFLPFSYLMDAVMYRAYRRRGGVPADEGPRRRGARAS